MLRASSHIAFRSYIEILCWYHSKANMTTVCHVLNITISDFCVKKLVTIYLTIISGDILSPDMAIEMFEYPRPFYKFISAEQEVHYLDRKLKNKSRKEAKWYRIAPHIDSITYESKLTITTCSENTAYKAGINRGS